MTLFIQNNLRPYSVTTVSSSELSESDRQGEDIKVYGVGLGVVFKV